MSSDKRIERIVSVLRECTSLAEAANRLGTTPGGIRGVLRRAGTRASDYLKPAAWADVESDPEIPVEWEDTRLEDFGVGGPFEKFVAEKVDKAEDGLLASLQRNGAFDTGPTADRTFVDKGPVPIRRQVTGLQSWVVFSDAHVPFEDKAAFDLVLDIANQLKPYGAIIIGDFADMLSVSSHPKVPEQMRWQLKDENAAVNARLDQIDAVGFKRKIFCGGNHSTRGQRLAMRQAMGLYDMLDPNHMFRLQERGWEYYPYRKQVKVGKAWFVHDVGHSGKYAAHQNGAAFEASTVQGHTHAAGITYFGNALGERHVSAVIGWLGSKEAADYLAPIKVTRNWTTAFAMMWVEEDTGNSHVQVIPIVEGRAVVNGRLFQAKAA